MRNRNAAPRTAQALQANSSTNQRAAARARAQAKERELEAARAKRLGTGKTKPKLPPGRAMLRGLEAFVRWRYRADGGRCVTDDGEMIVDVLLCFWASVARELGRQPGWARAWASIIVPVLAAEHDDRWWLARERRALRRRKGCGWTPGRCRGALAHPRVGADRMLWRGPSPSLRARQQRPPAGGPRGGPQGEGQGAQGRQGREHPAQAMARQQRRAHEAVGSGRAST